MLLQFLKYIPIRHLEANNYIYILRYLHVYLRSLFCASQKNFLKKPIKFITIIFQFRFHSTRNSSAINSTKKKDFGLC
jgi:hypothetical protein